MKKEARGPPFLLVFIKSLTGTYQISVAIGIIYFTYIRPEFILSNPWQRKSRLKPAIRMLPGIITDMDCRMRCILHNIIISMGNSHFNIRDLK